ncbi:MAG: FecR domain-containing protein [Desulfotignum sp.]|nr:FecR domain-containing protein [Desulfotignum sp.]
MDTHIFLWIKKAALMKMSVICLLIALLVPCIAKADTSFIGTIKTTKGDVTVIRSAGQTPGHVGDKLYPADVLQTGTNSSTGIIFEDNTVLSLGSDTEIIISDYVFAPEKGLFSMVIQMIKGTASYLSGIIGKQSPETVEFHTPDATINIRGTQFLVKVEI